MLAYVFWHWPRPGVSEAEYAACLARFHGDLAAAAPPGFRGTRVFGVAGGVPGVTAVPDDGELFEDWYFVDGFAELGVLNEAAVASHARAAHDRVAAFAAAGVGGVYKLCTARLAHPAWQTWISKPAGVSYSEFFGRLPPDLELWQRQMVLGPAPEFCAFAAARAVLDPLGGPVGRASVVLGP